ncbi:MAG TPA: helix-turn-helix transcriptional regulator [Steroidobacteraceae bacterium]|nr:helix-turn-helix transcriptional regulator [Steroidobacteraceae bacterium]
MSSLPSPRVRSRTGAVLLRLCRARDLLQDVSGNVRIEQAAREAALSPYHFIRLFKATFGATPHQVSIDARLERAKELLLAADLSVTEICLEVGFASLGSFSTLFARRVGASPAAYRRRVRAMIQVPGVTPPSLIPGCYSLMWGWPGADRAREPQLSRSTPDRELPQLPP